MTCLVGIIDKDKSRILIGGDSAGVSGLDVTIRKDPKVFVVGDFAFGCTSSFRMIQLIRYSFRPPEITAPCPGLGQERKDVDVFRYMCTAFVNSLRDCLREGGFLTKCNEAESGGEFLVGFRGRLFCIGADFQVGEPADGFDSVGCGCEYALGALRALTAIGDMDAESVARKALEAAGYFSAGVRPPYTFVEAKFQPMTG